MAFFGSPIPTAVRRLIQDCIGSAAQLEVLLLLWEQRHLDWNADEVSRELRSAPELAARSLADLHAAGLLTVTAAGTAPPAAGKDAPAENRYRFDPVNAEDAATVEALHRAYRERRYSVLDVIYSRPADGTLRAFSDAFRLRRDDD
jgi:hypothetical protein